MLDNNELCRTEEEIDDYINYKMINIHMISEQKNDARVDGSFIIPTVA